MSVSSNAALLVIHRPGVPERDAAWDWVKKRYECQHPDIPLVVECPPPGPVLGTAAMWKAYERKPACTDVVVIAGNDAFVPKSQLVEAIRLARLKPGIVMPFTDYLPLTLRGTQRFLVTQRPDTTDYIKFKVSHPIFKTSVGCIVVMSCLTWDTINGLDSRFEGWGPNDIAWALASATLCGPLRRLPGPAFHLWHPPQQEIPGATADPADKARFEASYAHFHKYEAAKGNRDQMKLLVAGNKDKLY